MKFGIMSFKRKYLFVFLLLSFVLTMALPVVTMSQENQTDKPNVLRQASLQWMQVGIRQYQSKQFEDAEKSFRRALVFKKYLTEAECRKINDYLTKGSIDLPEDEQPVTTAQPAKTEEKVKSSEPLIVKEQPQAEKEPKIINSQIEQKDQSVEPAQPEAPEIQLAAETTSEVIVIKDESLKSEFMRLSDWLGANRRNILLIGLPILAVFVIIMKLQKAKLRPGRRVYANYAPMNSSSIGAKLAGGNERKRAVISSKKRHKPPAVVANPERKSFSQTTDHWREKHFGHTADAAKKTPAKEKWPQQKDKPAATDAAVAEGEKKQCGKCKQLKPLSEFYKNKSTKDGLARWCKQCKKEYRQKRATEKK
jgi:hypothetical protein